jgi:putative tryptophan/tyrosine transport system substrate-binding protein
MRRRAFLGFVGSAAIGWPVSGRAEQSGGRTYKIGYLQIASREQTLHLLKALEDGLGKLGYRVGDNVLIEYRFANGDMKRLPALAADLVQLGVEIIVTGNNANTVAAMKATASIPIVMTVSVDPVGAGFVANLARPGGNITGLTQDTGDEINGKRLELLKDALPSLSRVGILWNPDFAPNLGRLKATREAARALDLVLVSAEARGRDALEQAFATMMSERAQAFIVLGEPVLFNYRDEIGAMALRNRLPAASTAREYAESGFLLSYGVDFRDLFRRAVVFVDKILKGAKPADLPVEQPTKFELLINLRTAKELGLTISREFLLIADEVIE